MKKMINYVLVFVLFCTMVTACGGDKKVSFETLEAARATANDNSKFNAIKWKTENAPELIVKMRGDSTQSNDCPQGDGWASIDLMNATGQIARKLKCSTYSVNLGCVEKKYFSSRSYAQEEGKCNNNVPFPIPKIGG